METRASGDKAARHCLTTRRYLVRGDGSTAHEGIFDTDTGRFIRHSTHQGWRDDSSWARGLTRAHLWFRQRLSIHGRQPLPADAEACAAYYIEHTPDHGLPPNDWTEPEPAQPNESSAAAIAASAFLQLSDLSADPLQASKYQQYAFRILDTLLQPAFLASETPNWEGILRGGMYHQSKGLGVNESVMWGDYFFLEALVAALSLLNGRPGGAHGASGA